MTCVMILPVHQSSMVYLVPQLQTALSPVMVAAWVSGKLHHSRIRDQLLTSSTTTAFAQSQRKGGSFHSRSEDIEDEEHNSQSSRTILEIGQVASIDPA